MGLNNWLILEDGDGNPGEAIAFRWGEIGEYEYRLGEKVHWERDARPALTAGEHFVPGLGNGEPASGDGRGFEPAYYLIRIIDDLIVSAEPTNETSFALAEAALVARGIPQ